MRKNYLRISAVLLLAAMSFTLFAVQASGNLRVFEISPNPMETFTNISLEFLSPSNVTVNLEDASGVVVTTFYHGRVQKDINLYWDRHDNSGNYVPNGKYQVVIQYSTRYTSTKKTLILK